MEKFSASLLNGMLVFGKYPTQKEANIIMKNNYNYIINLCPQSEVTWIPPEWNNVKIINYPFADGNIQSPLYGWDSFDPFLNKIIGYIENDKKVYIHCKGGHGRGATIAAIIYARITQCSSDEALQDIYNAHQNRIVMKPKWRKLGAPQRVKQINIVHKYVNL